MVAAVYRQPVTLETKVPEMIRSEDLLPIPNEAIFHKEINKVKKHIKQIKRKLAEKMEAKGAEVVPLSELEERKMKLQEDRIDLHKQRKDIEGTIKTLTKTIKLVSFAN